MNAPTRPRARQRAVMRLEPSRGITAVASAVMALIGAVLVVASQVVTIEPTGQMEQGSPGAASFDVDAAVTLAMLGFGLVFLVAGVVGVIVHSRRWRLHRRLVRLSQDPTFAGLMPATPEPVARAVSRHVPPLQVLRVQDRKLPTPTRLSVVTPTRNVIGQAPLRIGYLRLFENLPRSRTFVEGAWREFGPVYLLRSAGSVTPKELKAVHDGRPESVFLRTRQEVADALSGTGPTVLPKGRRVFRNLGHTTIRTRDRYGSYAPVAPLCHGATWRSAVDLVLDTVDVVVLDLSGFTPGNDGTAYELQRVVDSYPVERLLVIVDPHSDLGYLESVIRDAWGHMAPGSPNEGSTERALIMARTDLWRVMIRNNGGPATPGAAASASGGAGQGGQGGQTSETRLVADRKQTRRLAAWLQTELGHRSASVMDPASSDPRLATAPVGAPGHYAWRGTLAAAGVVLVLGLAAFGIWRMVSVPASQTGSLAVAAGVTPSPHTGTATSTPPVRPVRSVPDVVGRSLTEARRMIRAAGLTVGRETEVPSTEAAGQVLSSSPAAHRQREAGSPVHLTVASGRNVVPGVVGQSESDARAHLEQAGFQVSVDDTGCAPEVEMGTVCRMFPSAPHTAALGTTVILVVGAGPPPPDPGGGSSGPTEPTTPSGPDTSTSPPTPPRPTATPTPTTTLTIPPTTTAPDPGAAP